GKSPPGAQESDQLTAQDRVHRAFPDKLPTSLSACMATVMKASSRYICTSTCLSGDMLVLRSATDFQACRFQAPKIQRRPTPCFPNPDWHGQCAVLIQLQQARVRDLDVLDAERVRQASPRGRFVSNGDLARGRIELHRQPGTFHDQGPNGCWDLKSQLHLGRRA